MGCKRGASGRPHPGEDLRAQRRPGARAFV